MAQLSPKSEKRLRDLIALHNLSAAEDIFLKDAVPAIGLIAYAPDDDQPVGGTRYGGAPDLPKTIPWPQANGRFHNFVMQINLAELPEIAENPIPKEGMLYYFIEEDNGDLTAQVLFFNGDAAQLQPQTTPEPAQLAVSYYDDLKPHPIRCMRGVDIPSYGSETYRRFAEQYPEAQDPDASSRFFRLQSQAMRHTPEAPLVGQLLGHASSEVRGKPFWKLNPLPTGMNCRQYRDAHESEYQAEIAQWRLLWRIDSDIDVNANFNDAGSLHILIRNEDFQKLDFSGTLSFLSG
jgi:hypothetical protein